MDLPIKILSIDKGIVTATLQGTTLEIPIEALKRYMDRSKVDPLETVIRNIALRLNLSRTNIDTKADLIAALDNVIFKVPD